MVQLDELTLNAALNAAAESFPLRPAFAAIGENGLYNQMTYAEFGERARNFAALLMAKGVGPGDRVMILSENRTEWPVAYFGIALAGAVSVPVLTDFLSEHLRTVAEHAEIKAICATAKTLPKLEAAGIAASVPVIHLDDIVYGTEKLPELWPRVRENDPASIIYTSGTTGKSKGVVLSHRNIIFDARACKSIIKIYPRDRFLSVLPLAHTYECTIGLVIAVINGSSTTYLDRPPAPAALLPALKAIRPTMMLTVPLIIEKTYRNKILPALKDHPLYKLPLTKRLAIKAAGRKLMGTFGGAVRFFGIGGAALAPDVEEFLKLASFPYAIGYGLTETAPLLAGAAPFKTVLRSTGPALEGVELRIVDAEGKIVGGKGAGPEASEHAEGEIQARGPNVMLGYYKDKERTAEVFTADGWFKTGDLGSFDKKNRLFIRGRLKAMILGPSGENIYPEEIESILNASGVVEESLVYEGEKGELVALVVLNEKAKSMFATAGDMLQGAAQAVGGAAQGAAHAVGDVAQGAAQAVGDAAQGAAQAMGDAAQGAAQAVGDAAQGAARSVGAAAHHAGEALGNLKSATNKRLAAFSRIHRIEVQDEPFEKTATQKIKRFLYPKKK